MNHQLLKILRSVDADIISAFIERNILSFLLCIHRSGYIFFIDVTYYNIEIHEQTTNSLFVKRLNPEIDNIKNTTFEVYQQMQTEFPKYNTKLAYIIDSNIVLNMNRVYKILDPTDTLKAYGLFAFFDLSTLMNNKVSFQEDLMVMKEDLKYKLEEVKEADGSKVDLHSKMESIERALHSTDQFKNLYYSILHYIVSLKSEIKDLEDNSKTVNYNDTSIRLRQKEQKKMKLKSLYNLLSNVKMNVYSNYCIFLHRFIVYLYYRINIKKNEISLESIRSDFQRRFNLMS